MSPAGVFKHWRYGVELLQVLPPGWKPYHVGQAVTDADHGEMVVTKVTLRSPTLADNQRWPDMTPGSTVQHVVLDPIEEAGPS